MVLLQGLGYICEISKQWQLLAVPSKQLKCTKINSSTSCCLFLLLLLTAHCILTYAGQIFCVKCLLALHFCF